MSTPLLLIDGQIQLDETNRAAYRRLLAREYVSTWRTHPDVLEMHVRNQQFVVIEGVAAFEAARHTVAQALRGEVMAQLLRLPRYQTMLLIKGMLLTDSFKADERRYMQANGYSLESYNQAQHLAHLSWKQSGMFGPLVMDIASAVAHESLLKMEIICTKAIDHLSWKEILFLVAHYLDDISRGWEWCKSAVGDMNMLDFRTAGNAANPAYQLINETGWAWLRQQAENTFGPLTHYFREPTTTYEAQLETGKRVQARLVDLLAQYGTDVTPAELPEFIDQLIVRRFNQTLLAR